MLNPSHADIAMVAFTRFEARGSRHGRDQEDWLRGEITLKDQPDVETACAQVRTEVFLEEFFASQESLFRRHGVKADRHEIQLALMDRLGLDDAKELISKRLSSDDMADLVHDFPFSKLRPIVLGSIIIDHSELPSGLLSVFEEEVVKHGGDIWEIHKNDADPFPHPVHAHLKGTKYKLDFRDGKIYEKHNEVSSMKKKVLIDLRAKVRNINLPALTI